MARLTQIAAATLLLAGCSDPPEYKQAETAVARQFGYPGGVTFRNVRRGTLAGQVCGEARGRMENGEMTDFRRFSWQPGSVHVEGIDLPPPSEDDSVNNAMVSLDDTLVSLGCEQ